MRRAAALFALLTCGAAAPSASGADFGIVPGSVALRLLDAEGNPESRAGSHPDRLQVDFALNVEGTGTTPRDLVFELPAGLGGDPSAVPKCPRDLFEKGEEECPAESRVGTIELRFAGGAEGELPLFQVEAGPGEVLAFGTSSSFEAPLKMELRPDDFGITLTASELPEAALSEGRVELWGVPADRQEGTAIPRRPFLTAPVRCGHLAIAIRTRSWQPGAPWLSESALSDVPLDGCQGLTFEPRLGLSLDNPRADSPTGVRIDLVFPQNDDPDGLAGAQVASAAVSLPEEVTVSPGGAGSLTACSDAQLGLGAGSAPSCPPSSRVGSVEVESPILPDPLSGAVYLGAERPDERFRMFMALPAPGLTVKLVTALRADPATGRLTTGFDDLPELPMSRLTLQIDGGPGALLASPLSCASHAAGASLTPSGGGAPVESSAAVTIGLGPDGAPCTSPPPFAPQLAVSRSSQAAGRPTSFDMTLRRRAGEQLASRFAVTLPRGMSAALGAIEPCPDSAVALGECPGESRIGDAFVELGAGASAARLPGEVYAAGPHGGAPFSLAIAFDAAIGPFDLGRIALRAAVHLHRRTGRATVVSDPMPEAMGGVRVRMRTIRMTMSRRGLVRNPTSCAPNAIVSRVYSSAGATATARSAVSVRRCDRLAFAPRFSLVLEDRAGGAADLRMSARLRPHDANLRSLRLSLPPALRFSSAGLKEICPRRDAIAGLCSTRARVGVARTRSPILPQPLAGAVYTVQPQGNGLPDLWVGLKAAETELAIGGRAWRRRGRFVTGLTALPDMPLTTFAMRLNGAGGSGLLRGEPCEPGRRTPLVAWVAAKAQNGSRRQLRLPIRVRCGRAAGRGPHVAAARALTAAPSR